MINERLLSHKFVASTEEIGFLTLFSVRY